MNYVYLFLMFFLAVMVFIYFIPYKRLRGKIFKRLIWKEPSKLHFISYITSGYTIKLERVDITHWMYFYPDRWDANDSKVMRLAIRLSEVMIDSRYSDKNDHDVYQIGKHGELELQYGNDVIVISIGCKSDGGELVYVKSSHDSDVLAVSSTILSVLPQNVDDFKQMLLFNEYYSNVSGIEIRFNEKSVVMDRREDGWLMNGNHIFNDNAKPVIEKLLLSEASGFAKDGVKLPAKPVGSIIIKLVDGDMPITRYLFEDEFYPNEFLAPYNSKIMLVPKNIIDTFNLQ